MSAEAERRCVEDEFARPVETGMTRSERRPEVPDAALVKRLEEFESVRNRGAVEARSFWLG